MNYHPSFHPTFSFQLTEIQNLLEDFYLIANRQVGLFDANGNVLLRYPDTMPDFCQRIRSFPEGQKGCESCDRRGCQMAAYKGKLTSYPCHAGLTEVCMPIRWEGSVVGFLMFGHLVEEEQLEATWRRVRRKCLGRFGEEESLKDSFTKLPVESFRRVQALSRILEICVSYIQQEHLGRFVEPEPLVMVDRFLREHLEEEISVPDLCRNFQVSVSTLEREMKRKTGKTLREYWTGLRMERARHLLKNSSLRISEVAQAVGYGNYNYFSRVFKKSTGMTARDFRKL